MKKHRGLLVALILIIIIVIVYFANQKEAVAPVSQNVSGVLGISTQHTGSRFY